MILIWSAFDFKIPPNPPFQRGGNIKTPFIKGGFRGIFLIGFNLTLTFLWGARLKAVACQTRIDIMIFCCSSQGASAILILFQAYFLPVLIQVGRMCWSLFRFSLNLCLESVKWGMKFVGLFRFAYLAVAGEQWNNKDHLRRIWEWRR